MQMQAPPEVHPQRKDPPPVAYNYIPIVHRRCRPRSDSKSEEPRCRSRVIPFSYVAVIVCLSCPRKYPQNRMHPPPPPHTHTPVIHRGCGLVQIQNQTNSDANQAPAPSHSILVRGCYRGLVMSQIKYRLSSQLWRVAGLGNEKDEYSQEMDVARKAW